MTKNGFEIKVRTIKDYFLSCLSNWDIYPNDFEQDGIEKRIFDSLEPYFKGVKSPHGMMTEEENYACDVTEVLEDFLEQEEFTVPSTDREGLEGEARLYGCEFSEIFEEVADIIEATDVKEEILSIAEDLLDKTSTNNGTCHGIRISDIVAQKDIKEFIRSSYSRTCYTYNSASIWTDPYGDEYLLFFSN